MFSVYCERHGAEVLLGVESVTCVENTGDAIVVRLRCYCGYRLVVRTGCTDLAGAADRQVP